VTPAADLLGTGVRERADHEAGHGAVRHAAAILAADLCYPEVEHLGCWPAGIRLCDQDIRAQLRTVAGRQSRFSNGTVEVSHTVTSGGDTTDFLQRFESVVAGCPGPWREAPLPTGGGPVTREIIGTYPVPDVGVDGAGAIIRSSNAAGSTDTVVIVLVQGAVVSSLSVSGPEGADFDVVEPAIRGAADRLPAAQSPAGP
jgi:hypothetical protein